MQPQRYLSGQPETGVGDGGEVDEISEVGEIPEGLKEERLENFLAALHGEEVSAPNGMPSLEWLKKHFKTKSAVIRYLNWKGHAVKDIAKHCGFRYQHVRNVLTNAPKRGPNEDYRISGFDHTQNVTDKF